MSSTTSKSKGEFWDPVVTFLCVASIGMPTLEKFKAILEEPSTKSLEETKEGSTERLLETLKYLKNDEFTDWKLAFFDRLTNVNVVTALVLTVSTTFIVTPAPPKLPWDHKVPYAFLLVSLLYCILGLGIGMTNLFMFANIDRGYGRDLIKSRTRRRILYLALPAVLSIYSALATSCALVCAAWLGDSTSVKIVLTMTISILSMVAMTIIFYGYRDDKKNKKQLGGAKQPGDLSKAV